MMEVSSGDEMCRVLQFLDHFVHHCDVREVLPSAAGLGKCISDGC